jgi:shikimate kinase
MNIKRIYITGFMTSGKSTVGPILANVLGFNFIDLDKEIESTENLTVVEIFEKKGESYFRDLETSVLKKFSEQNNLIIALGGGTITNDTNIEIIKRTGKILYLKVSPNILYRRLKNKIDRPLIRDMVLDGKSEEEFVQKIEDLLEKRKKYYEQADLIIESDAQPLGVTIDKIAKKISVLFDENN